VDTPEKKANQMPPLELARALVFGGIACSVALGVLVAVTLLGLANTGKDVER
jgi:hypothetical protein